MLVWIRKFPVSSTSAGGQLSGRPRSGLVQEDSAEDHVLTAYNSGGESGYIGTPAPGEHE